MTAPPLFRLAMIGVLAISFALSACGRKAGLDPPPKSTAAPAAEAQRQAQTEPTEDEHGNPILQRGPKKGFLLDWLLN